MQAIQVIHAQEGHDREKRHGCVGKQIRRNNQLVFILFLQNNNNNNNTIVFA